MKKLILISALILCLIPGVVFAAGTVTASEILYDGLSGKWEVMKVTYTVTFDAAAAPPAAVALTDILDTNWKALRTSVQGWWLFRIDVTFGGTAPKINTDFRLWSVEDKIDVLGASGLNQIDNATHSSFYPASSTQPLTGEEIFDVDPAAENDEVNAACEIIFTLYR